MPPPRVSTLKRKETPDSYAAIVAVRISQRAIFMAVDKILFLHHKVELLQTNQAVQGYHHFSVITVSRIHSKKAACHTDKRPCSHNMLGFFIWLFHSHT